ncbi:MAG TPA: FlgD immunoglobulin-like domain containing protein [Candidatus Cloacimonadota bacterium]|nr:FlgD immunoglobulin-like domain containing protein [Candidatus Cloacimonadota bacterium]
MKRLSFISLFILLVATCLSAVTVSYDFNDTKDLFTYFNLPVEGNVTNSFSGGIGDTGAVLFPGVLEFPLFPMGQTRVITLKNGIYLSEIDEPVTITAHINSFQNGGYAAMGFSSASSNTAAPKCQITNVPAVGMQFYSSGYSFFNNTSEYIGSYPSDIPLSWYKVIYTLIPRGADLYDVSYELWRTNQSEGFLFLQKSGVYSFTNPTINDGPVYPYFGIDGHRVSYVDNFTVSYPEEATLPVTMSSFTATVASETQIYLQWTTESESNILGYNVYRSEDSIIANAIKLNPSFIEGTNTSSLHTYHFTDFEFEPNTSYYYWVESTELSNNSSFYGPVSVLSGDSEEDAPPIEIDGNTGIVRVSPNPFSPNTDISYKLRETAHVTMGIYNAKGQLVRSLVNGTKDSGNHSINWDGKDHKGTRCSNGIYYARMQAGSVNSYYKMTLMK